nr:trypsin-like serine protease [Kibdelosporangium sp. MJ126-NF4]CTQ88550.1 secreted trypsin-like serine protease [Kibdelosporangium sp. MJ126-NF4]
MFRRIVLCLSTVALAVTAGVMAPAIGVAVPNAAQPLIVGGRPASEPYPSFAKLNVPEGFVCGGVVIAPLWVATAKHCLEPFGPVTFVRIGGTTLAEGERIDVVQRIGAPGDSDLGLLKLAKPTSATPTRITRAPLAPGLPVRIIGHGQTCPEPECGGASRTLNELDTKLHPPRDCYGIAANEICVGDAAGVGNPGKGACYGDSGGPAFTKVNGTWELAGTTSRSGGGAVCTWYPSIYNSVPAHRSFIEQHTTPLP